MTLNQLLYFQSVARNQHFRQASLELNISQPSLSRSVSALEEELGIILFERAGRNIRITKYGQIFLEHVDRILGEVDVARERMKQLAGSKGHVDVAYVFPLSSSYIPHMARQFLKKEKNSKITFSFYQRNTTGLIAGLKADKYDIIFCSYVENEPDIQFIPVIHQKMKIITPLDHPLARKGFAELSDLEHYPVIGYEKTSGLGSFTNQFYKAHSLEPHFVCESPDEQSISALVAEDFGIAFVADVEQIADGRVCILPLKDMELNHTVYLAYKKDHYLISAVKDFIQFIKKEGTHL
jgi:DNA-binding transcriptional LysR family regulator